MKFRITMKDPDCVYDAVQDAMKDLKIDGVSEDEMVELREKREEQTRDLCDKWFEYGEYLTVEVDTEAKTCTVIPNSN